MAFLSPCTWSALHPLSRTQSPPARRVAHGAVRHRDGGCNPARQCDDAGWPVLAPSGAGRFSASFRPELAAALGLPVASVEARTTNGRSYLLVTRYDRRFDDTGRAHRLHQEDFCQTLSIPPQHKYAAEDVRLAPFYDLLSPSRIPTCRGIWRGRLAGGSRNLPPPRVPRRLVPPSRSIAAGLDGGPLRALVALVDGRAGSVAMTVYLAPSTTVQFTDAYTDS